MNGVNNYGCHLGKYGKTELQKGMSGNEFYVYEKIMCGMLRLVANPFALYS